MPWYETDKVTVWHGDCLDVLAGMADNSVDAIVTDPPYALPGGFMAKTWDAFDGREDAGFGYWLAGLIDGEGHFAIKAHSRGTHAPMFQLSMRRDERGTLEMIQRHLRIGTLTELQHEPNPVVRWIVQDKAGCQRLVDLLDKYPLRAKKRMDYAIWRESVCEWTSRPRGNRWHGAADNSHMAGLRERLMSGRGYVDPPWSGHEFQDWCRLWATECIRVLKPGGHMLAFGGTRTWHRLVCGIEDAGFEIRDSVAWIAGQGFPKSLNVSKAIEPRKLTAPATPEAQQWEGWGTALKPAHEPICVARKPLTGTVAANVLEWGTGAVNIDAGRIGTGGAKRWESPRGGIWTTDSEATAALVDSGAGRWPANVALDGYTAELLDQQSGDSTSGSRKPGNYGGMGYQGSGTWDMPGVDGDTGGASRFFYTAKAPSDERYTIDGVSHPTVKPLDLMQWLVRMYTPPGGIILDPFAGTGTTGEAALTQGFRAILIEQDATYLPLIKARLTRRTDPVEHLKVTGCDLGLFDLPEA